ncbi:MAG: SDR family oxidoreductase [Pyrinomonadaceae bacterium]
METRVIVTGATSGIGNAVVRQYLRAGARIAAFGRDREALMEVASLADESVLRTFACDLASGSEWESVMSEACGWLGEVDVLVNSAGIIANGTIENTGDSDWDRMISVNLTSVFKVTKFVVARMRRPGGAVVNVSSVAGTRAFPNVLAYCVSKAGVDQLTRCSALELAEAGIRVNAVNPGVVVSNLHRRSGMDEGTYSGFLEHSKTTHPLGRVGNPDEIADLICFLASEKAGWITGETVAIDGGRGQTCAR